ncbi:MAG: proline--tRNA ligase [Dehalococcoidia bacterium]
MRMSRLFGRTLREAPGDAETAGHALLLRGSFIDQLMSGVYSYLPLGWRVERKVEHIIREEMDAAGAQEVHLPVIQPIELWEKTGRKRVMGDVLFQLVDRRERALALGPTHEEVITQLFDRHSSSYRDLPVTLYQIQTKFRDEARPRGGLVRVREFTMKDAYSFDLDDDGLDASYDAMFRAYHRIFARCGVPVVAVEADSGAIGGKGSQEFVFLTEIGEDTIVMCDACGYAANAEKAEFVRPQAEQESELPLEPISTPGMTSIDDLARFLDIPAARTAKAVFFMATMKDGTNLPVFAVVRGDLDVNEVKLMNAVGAAAVRPMLDGEVAQHGLVAGYASPIDAPPLVQIVADRSIPESPNLVAGANRIDAHLRNVNYGRDWTAKTVADIALAQPGHRCPRCEGGTLQTARGIEMGHVFRLNDTYTRPMEVSVLGADGKPVTPTMGCYGIGLGRIVAAAIEQHHDDKGAAWPASIAPYAVHLVGLGLDRDDDVRADADRLYDELTGAGLEVLFDDRAESPGVKFNDADLLGMPIRLTVSSRNHKAGVVELQLRDGGRPAEPVARAGAVAHVRALRDELVDALRPA